MEPIKSFTSTIVALPLENVDTDQIIPAKFLKVTDKSGLGEGAKPASLAVRTMSIRSRIARFSV